MISKERLEELKTYFWEESNDEVTQYWREDLTQEEQELIDKWDTGYSNALSNICKEIAAYL